MDKLLITNVVEILEGYRSPVLCLEEKFILRQLKVEDALNSQTLSTGDIKKGMHQDEVKDTLTQSRIDMSAKEKAFIPFKDRTDSENDNINKVYPFLIKFFYSKSLTVDDFMLNRNEFLIVDCILSSKIKEPEMIDMFKEIRETGDLRKLSRFNQQMEKAESKKRNDEKLKFIFKNTMKHLLLSFYKEKGLRKSKESEIQFWNDNFARFCVEKEIPIEHVYDPLKTSFIKNTMFKNLNKSYFERLFLNEPFKEKFYHYVQTELKSNYQRKLSQKVKNALVHLQVDPESKNHPTLPLPSMVLWSTWQSKLPIACSLSPCTCVVSLSWPNWLAYSCWAILGNKSSN